MLSPAIRICVTAAVLAFCACAQAQNVTVFAAASLTDALGELAKTWGARSGMTMRSSFAASSTLARQIESGAPADIFFSADEEWMDYLDKRALLEAGTRVSRLGNRLVLVAPAGAPRRVEIRKGVDIGALLGASGRLVTGDPASVPVGRYAQQALSSLGLWGMIGPRIARAENVRIALAYVERGEAPLGIVYATDAAVAKGVQVVGEFPADSHAPISYPLALVAGRATSAARALRAFLLGEESGAVFRKHGFSLR